MVKWLGNIWHDDKGQDVAEYAVMLAVILVIVVGHDPPDRLQRQQRVLFGRQRDSVSSTELVSSLQPIFTSGIPPFFLDCRRQPCALFRPAGA